MLVVRTALRSLVRLALWLGPWTGDDACPQTVTRRAVLVRGRTPFEAWVYRPAGRRPDGALLLVPGLHYAGPADPRLDRFARVLADAGLLVLSPFLPDFTALRVAPGLMADTEASLEALRALPDYPAGLRPGVFSISFGSLPALRLAAHPDLGPRLGGTVVFGGYADFRDTIRFCLEGAPGRPHDPLNRPVVFMNLLDRLESAPEDPGRLLAAWTDVVTRTWGRPEMKERARSEPIAREVASRLNAADRLLFLQGCGHEPGGDRLCHEALDRGGDAWDWLDPRPHLSSVSRPVVLVHGRDDDVIPFEQSELLERAMPPGAEVRRLLTGLYSHTGQTGLVERVADLPALARELASMLGILRAVDAVARRRR